MASRINIDLAQMPQFFKGVEEVCNSFCQNQQQIDRAFNTIEDTWRDKNAVTTCTQLEETARGISMFYDRLNEAVEYVVRVCNNRAEYVDYGSITPPQIVPFTINITEITQMDNAVINTNPDALEEFKCALDKYIQSIVNNVECLSKLYNRIGDSWNDEQYEKFGDALSKFTGQMQSQVDILDRISAFLKGRIEILRRSDI